VNRILPVIAAAVLAVAVSCSNRPNTLIEGNFSKAERKYIRLEFLDINKTLILDSVRIKSNGNFRFRFFVDQPGLYILRNENGKIINLIVSQGDRISVKGEYEGFDKGYSVAGSKESEHIRMLVEKLSDTRNRLRELDSAYYGKDGAALSEYRIRRYMVIREQRDSSISFIISHLSSMASIYALYQKLSPEELVLGENRDIQFMKIVADSVAGKYPKSDFAQTFVKDARSSEQRFLNLISLQKKITNTYNEMPDIALKDISGASRSLQSLKGKIVLLYFWSAYSDIAREQNSVLEKTYRKYKSKGFEIFAVNIDSNTDVWAKLVKYDGLTFINVSGPDIPDSEIAHTYNLRTVPSSYLIGRDGIILERDLFGPDLEKWLDNKL
jgi:peroxiredoxin